MALAILTGTGWTALRETIPGFAPVPEEHVVLAGARDLEPYQRARLGRSARPRGARRVRARGRSRRRSTSCAGRVERVYLHVDLDVLDSRAGRANEYAAPGGPGPDVVVGAVDAVFDRFDGRRRRPDRLRPGRGRQRPRPRGRAARHRADPRAGRCRPGDRSPGRRAARPSPRASPARSSRSRSAACSSGAGSHCAGIGQLVERAQPEQLEEQRRRAVEDGAELRAARLLDQRRGRPARSSPTPTPRRGCGPPRGGRPAAGRPRSTASRPGPA